MGTKFKPTAEQVKALRAKAEKIVDETKSIPLSSGITEFDVAYKVLQLLDKNEFADAFKLGESLE